MGPSLNDDLDKIVERGRQLGADARHDARFAREGAPQAPPPGTYPEHLGVTDDPAVHRADADRRQDDLATARMQARAAADQTRAAETLDESEWGLSRSAEMLDETGERLRASRADMEDLFRDTEQLRRSVDRTREQVRRTDPRVD